MVMSIPARTKLLMISIDDRLENLLLLLVVLSQHPVNLVPADELVTDTDAQARILLTDELLDMAQSVMTAITASCFQSAGTQRKCNLISDDEHVLLVDILLL